MNIFQKALSGESSSELEFAAGREFQPVDRMMKLVAEGRVVILKNSTRHIDPVAVGELCSTKINANIGTSPDLFDIAAELEKLDTAIKYGADTIMDLSIGGDVGLFRKKIIASSPAPLGTVPLYEVVKKMVDKKKSVMDFNISDFLSVVKQQAQDGVDFMTIHSGVTLESVKSLSSHSRIIGITSRGGSIIGEWMKLNNRENPLFEYYDDILDILAEYNVAISLGDGLRPGATHDANDRGQIHEMVLLGDLAKRARAKGVQAIIEGPGHMPLDMIADNMRIQKTLCDGAPYYVLGPLVTDIAPGYDHITGAIGGAIAAAAGADFLCYVTPAEHLRLPSVDDVREGVIASKIAAHAADMIKLGGRARETDDEMSRARKARDWESMFKLAIDPEKARQYHQDIPSNKGDQCSMCGDFCAIKRNY
jgi:phosphomethylpyrimidine synthase